MRKVAGELTALAVEKAKVPEGGAFVELRCGKLPGFTCRKFPGGGREWRYRYTSPLTGRRRQATLGRGELTLSAARALAADMAREIGQGGDPLARKEAERRALAAERAEAEAGSFAALCELYLRRYRKRGGAPKRTLEEDRRKIARDLSPAWGDRPAGSIDAAEVRRLVRAIADGRGARRAPGRPAPVAANRTLALVSKLYTFAVEDGFPGVTANPAFRIARPGVETERDRALSEPEIAAFWRATAEEPVVTRCALRLALATGLRRGELLGATWGDLAEDEWGLWLEVPASRSKTGRPIRQPLSTLAREVLRDLDTVRDGGGLLFPSTREGKRLSDPKKAVARVHARMVAELGEVAPFRFHDLRRTFRSQLSAAQVPLDLAERLLNHVRPGGSRMAAVYDRHHHAPERMQAVEVLARRLRAIIAGAPQASVLSFRVGA
ncbi:MAG: tyrosine-type recombinase/integrase [Thermoanaerobaculia bacterium]|nr:tyrosine-type recombinase/integrase [Thermoanaerobaculia bacterium]